jgi:hypothetical protein
LREPHYAENFGYYQYGRAMRASSYGNGKEPMIDDSIRTYRIQLDPEGIMPNVDVGVRVDGRDIPEASGNYVAVIFVDRVVHTLGELLCLDKAKVTGIREDLEAGGPVHIEVQVLRTQLIQAGFILE